MTSIDEVGNMQELTFKGSFLLFFSFVEKSIESGTVPHDFKNANVTPIFKKGNRSSPENFRPVSITTGPHRGMNAAH